MITVREAVEDDAEGIKEIFDATYHGEYPHQTFLHSSTIKKLIYADDAIMIVAQDSESGRVLGTASVLEAKGSYTDLVGEFGRLVVHPDGRNEGIGNKLMQGRLAAIENRLHVGIVEARIVHQFSARISAKNNFGVVGYIPSKYVMSFRENIGLFAQHFGKALPLRKNHPRIIPEAYSIAHLAARNCGLELHAIVDEQAAPYPYCEEFEVEQMTADGYAGLLFIERGRLRNREIYGPLRLHYGFFKLQAKNSNYLIAKSNGQIRGAIGYINDEVDKAIQIFELISTDDEVVRFLLSELVRRADNELDSAFISCDVSAYAPRMQRTLLELGFLPCAYIPALVFQDVERLDIVKMCRLNVPLDYSHDDLIPEVEEMAGLVRRLFEAKAVHPRIMKAMSKIQVFSGLSDEQKQRLASYCALEKFGKDDCIFSQGSESKNVYLLLKGEVEVQIDRKVVGTVSTGESLGEVAALSDQPHSASAVASSMVETGVLRRSDLEQLIRMRPDIGVVLYRNIAVGLGSKLSRVDRGK